MAAQANVLTERALRELQQITEALNRINETIHASLDTGEIMQHLVSEGAAALGSETAAISLCRADRWTVGYVHGMPDSLVGAQMGDDEERHAMLAIRTRQPVVIADALNDDRVKREHMRRHNIRAVLVAPLIVRDEPFGALFFNYHSGPHTFSEAQVQFAAQLASTAAIALENGRLFEERNRIEEMLRRQNDVLKAVNRILEATLTAATEEDLGQACLAVVEEVTGSKFGFIGEIGADGLLHEVAISDPGWDACRIPVADGQQRPAGDFRVRGIYGRVVLDGKGFYTNDPASHPDRVGMPAGHPPLTSFLGVPLNRDHETIGMIALGNREEGYGPEQLVTVEALAPVIVEAFLRKRAEEEAEEGQRILEALMESVPEGITIATEPDAEIRIVSRRGQELLGGPHAGLTADQVAAQWKVYRLDGVTPVADADLPLVRAIQQGEVVRDDEIVQVAADGRRLTLSCNAAPIRDREGEITGGVVAWRDVTELREAERRHSRILASALNGLWITDLEGRIREVNDSLCRMLGYSRTELLAMNIADVEVDVTPAEVLAHIAALQRTGSDHFESRHRRKDGTIIDVEMNTTYLESGGGQAVGFCQDISKRKRVERELRENREWLHVTLTSIGDGVIATDADGRITFLNPVAESLTGWTQGEALARPIQQVFNIVDEKTRLPGQDLCTQVLRERRPISLSEDAALLARDGRTVPIEDSAAPILDAAGEMTGVVLVFQDVAEKRRAQEALRESDERFRFMLENSFDAAYRRNLRTDRYDYMAPAFEQITGWSVEEMNAADAETVLARIHPDDRAMVRAEMDRTRAACEAGEPATGTLEYRFLGKDGSYRWLGDHINVLAGAGGRALYRLGIVRDITPRKRSEEELHRLNRTLRARSHSDHALLRATTEAEFMADVCRIIVEDCGHAMVWIGFAEDDEEKSVRPVAYAGFEEGYLETLHITWADTPRGRGPTGMAVRNARPSFCRNMLTDPQFEPWREEALARGYASSLVLPLLEGGKAFGALTIYFREPDPFTPDEIDLLQGLADDLAYGIRMLRLREAHAVAEQALRESEKRYRELFDRMTEGFGLHEIICDEEGVPYDYRFLDVNPAFESLTGLKREELIGNTVLDVLPETEPFWIETYGRVALTGKPVHFEQHSASLDRHFEVLCFRPAEGHFAALFLDITERKLAKEILEKRVQERTAELQASEERFRQLAENIHEVFWMLEPDSRRVLYVSPAYDAVWGRSRQTLFEEPTSFLDTVHPDDREKVLRGFGTRWQGYNGEFRVLRPDGTPRWIQVRSFPVYNERGEVYRLAGVATDRTEQKAAEAALLQAERLTTAGKLAASVAHEINNPLQSVMGCLGLATGALETGRDPASYLDVAQKEVQRTARIVSQLRSLGRPFQDGHKEPADLNGLLNDVLVLNKKHLQTHKIEVIWEPDVDLPMLSAVPDAIRQVFLNLVINAADAMPNGGQLWLSTAYTASPAGVRVVVADSGTGIEPEVLTHLFEPFYSTKLEGLGVGLFLSQSIVQQHGGRIEVESQPGAGATFTVWLPT
jgi:PAS domain S-box-containing protein